MQTFMPHDSFEESVAALDDKRLRNQRNECKVILKTLLGEYPETPSGRPGGWPFHPATLMWKGYEYSLCCYALEVCREAIRREWLQGDLTEFFTSRRDQLEPGGTPLWMGKFSFHESHRSNLIRKDPDYYGPQWPATPDDLPYIWPTKEGWTP